MNESISKNVMTSAEYLRQDREARIRYEERQKFLHDEASALEWAFEKGYQEGLKLGRERGKRMVALATAKTLLAEGVETTLISEVTGLTEAEIQSLK